MIAVIDYGAGNLGSVANVLGELGCPYVITSRQEEVLDAQAVILPGVGAAGDCMEKLTGAGMADVIKELVSADKPLLAICVGLQVLFETTEEGGGSQCLDILPGKVRKLPRGIKIPHMGWNGVKQVVKHWIFDGIPDGAYFYFVHSYYAVPADESIMAGVTDYGISFCSMIIKNNLVATQYHPEKSGRWGLKMYSNFLDNAIKGI